MNGPSAIETSLLCAAVFDEIPGEIEKESAHLRDRYRNPSARLFPVAVTYLIPRKHVLGVGGGRS